MTKTPERVARRYARALFESYQPGDLDAVLRGLTEMSSTWSGSQELRETLSNPAYPLRLRSEVVRSLARALRANDAKFENFLVLLLENRRLDGISDVTLHFSTMLDELKKLLSLDVVSAFDVPESERAALLDRVRQVSGGLASIAWSKDPALLGGLLVKCGDTQLDGTVRGALEQARAGIIG